MAGAEPACTRRELMVACAAREIRDGDVVFVGMRLPLLAFALAVSTHAPEAVGVFENGVMRDTPPRGPVVTMSDPPNLDGALWAGALSRAMGLLAGGHVDVGFIGGAQIDRHACESVTLITTRAVLRAAETGGSFELVSVHPGEDAAVVVDDTPWGWPDPPVRAPAVTLPPSAEVLQTLRALDPDRVWTGDG